MNVVLVLKELSEIFEAVHGDISLTSLKLHVFILGSVHDLDPFSRSLESVEKTKTV